MALVGREGVAARELTFDEVRRHCDVLVARWNAAGFGPGHRVALMLGNQPEHFVAHLALNALGASAVPLNPDLTAHELSYVLEHSDADLVIAAPALSETVARALARLPHSLACVTLDEPCPAPRRTQPPAPGASAEASLLYTSGTTGRPKGCMLANAYYLRIGLAYSQAGGWAAVREASERILNPLPVFHQNAGIFSFMCALLSGNCIVMTDRFHASTWWDEVATSRATIVHYLGVMPAILLKLPVSARERQHAVRFGIGAGVEPSLHAPFEERFGFPLIELWGMTESGCGFIACESPREIGTRAVGGPRPDHAEDLLVRLVDDEERDVPDGGIGELLVRRAGDDPAEGMFSGYLKDPQATQEAWRGGWFHTGDAFWRDASGVLHFAERKKNIIRRSGENIAAAEVEAVLLDCPEVVKAAVIAAPDELRDEEVLACVVATTDTDDAQLAHRLFTWCGERLAYYKTPGWIVFLDEIPVTTTQKVQKARIFAPGVDPRHHARAIDLRAFKKRQVPPPESTA